MIRFVARAKVDAFVAARPPGYLEELAPAIVERTAAGIIIDDQHPAYLAAWRKYRLGPVTAEVRRISKICQAHASELGRQPDCVFGRKCNRRRRELIETRGVVCCPEERWRSQLGRCGSAGCPAGKGVDDGEG